MLARTPNGPYSSATCRMSVSTPALALAACAWRTVAPCCRTAETAMTEPCVFLSSGKVALIVLKVPSYIMRNGAGCQLGADTGGPSRIGTAPDQSR